VILVACQKDLRTDPQTIANLKKEGRIPISTEVGRGIAAQIQADAYMKCSAKTGEGVEDLFIHAACLITQRTRSTVHSKCIIQ
jgi:GTPase SAR1 family protein